MLFASYFFNLTLISIIYIHTNVFTYRCVKSEKKKILAVLEAKQDYLAVYNTEKHKQETKYCIRSIKTFRKQHQHFLDEQNAIF